MARFAEMVDQVRLSLMYDFAGKGQLGDVRIVWCMDLQSGL